MDKMTFKFDNISHEDLEALAKAIDDERIRRKSARFTELTTAAADALNALQTEFPGVILYFHYQCPECNDYSTGNIFESYSHFEAGYFHRT